MITGITILGTMLVTLMCKEGYTYYKEQKEIKKAWEKQELIALIQKIVDDKLKEIVNEK